MTAPGAGAVVYVVSEYPARTQTFVASEVRELRRLGVDVLEFPLRGKHAGRLLGPGLNIRRPFLGSVAADPLLIVRAIRAVSTVLLLGGGGLARRLRQVFAIWRALQLVVQVGGLEGRDVLRIHAHFLGRTFEVAHCARDLGRLNCHVSGTAHAAEAVIPREPQRLARLVERSDFIACASEYVRGGLAALLAVDETTRPHPRLEIVHCGIEVAPPRRSAATRRRLRVLTVGRLVPKKGYDDALAAAEILDAEGAEFEWLFVGDGPMFAYLDHRSRALEGGVTVRLVGHEAHDEVLRLLGEQTDIFVLPSKPASDDIDGIPVALMEAMTRAVPVIATAVAGIPELVSSGETGLLVAPGEPSALADQLAALIGDSQARSEIGDRGKTFVDKHFNLVIEAERLRTLLLQ